MPPVLRPSIDVFCRKLENRWTEAHCAKTLQVFRHTYLTHRMQNYQPRGWLVGWLVG